MTGVNKFKYVKGVCQRNETDENYRRTTFFTVNKQMKNVNSGYDRAQFEEGLLEFTLARRPNKKTKEN